MNAPTQPEGGSWLVDHLASLPPERRRAELETVIAAELDTLFRSPWFWVKAAVCVGLILSAAIWIAVMLWREIAAGHTAVAWVAGGCVVMVAYTLLDQLGYIDKI